MHRVARALLGTTVALLSLAGCATSTAGSGRPAADGRTGGGGTPSTLPVPPTSSAGAGTPTPAPSTGSAGPTPAGEVVVFGTVRLPLTPGSTAKVDGELLCVTLLNDTGCSLEVIDIGRIRAAGGSVSTPAPGAEYGWWWGSDVPSCGSGARTSVVTTSTVLQKAFRSVGAKNAAYGHWSVSCADSDLDFDPRLWWLPTSQLAFRERSTVAGTGPAVDKLLAGVTFSA